MSLQDCIYVVQQKRGNSWILLPEYPYSIEKEKVTWLARHLERQSGGIPHRVVEYIKRPTAVK